MAEVEYALGGPWWTLDGPSLRIPTPSGRYVSVWMTGDGPPVALLPAPGRSADWWLPVVPALQTHVTVVALDNEADLRPDELVSVLRGTGANVLVADGEASVIALAARASGSPSTGLVLHGSVPSVNAGPDVLSVGRAGDAPDANLDDLVAAARALIRSTAGA